MNPSVEQGLKVASRLAAGAGALVPLLSPIIAVAPPLFPVIGSVISAVAAAVVIAVSLYQFRRPSRKAGLPTGVRRGLVFICLAIAAIALYALLLDSCSVDVPGRSTRVQVGFGTRQWTLTRAANEVKARSPELDSPYVLMLSMGGFEPGGVYRIWRKSTVYAAGSLTMLAFLAAAVLWTLGWSLLGRAIGEARGKAVPAGPADGAKPVTPAKL